MRALVTGLLLIPVLDQALKFFVLFRLGPRSVPLGRIGKLQVGTDANLDGPPATLSEPNGALDGVYLLGACALIVVSSLAPSCGWFAGVLGGGSVELKDRN